MLNGINQIFFTLVLFELITPTVSLAFLIILRTYVLVTRSVPGVIQELNQKMSPVELHGNEVTQGFLYACFFHMYFTAKFIMALKFWRNSQGESSRMSSIIWIVVTIVICIIGFLLLYPLKAHGVAETGLCFVFLILSTIISTLTIFFQIFRLIVWHKWIGNDHRNTTINSDSLLMTTSF